MLGIPPALSSCRICSRPSAVTPDPLSLAPWNSNCPSPWALHSNLDPESALRESGKDVHLPLNILDIPCLARVKRGLGILLLPSLWPQPVSPQAPRARLVFNDFLSCFRFPPSPLSPCLSFGPARGGRCRSSDTPAKEATDYCPGSLSRCLMPVLSDRPGEAMLGRGKPRVLTLPWNLYYIERQQLSSRGPFGNVQSVCRWRFT